MSFTVQTMLGQQALVSGSDHLGNEGKTLVSTKQWEELQSRTNFSSAQADFDAAVEEFFGPLVEAADKAKQALAPKPQDSASYIVLKEKTEGTKASEGLIVELSKDSIILRLIEEGNTDRLVWIDESTLGILAA